MRAWSDLQIQDHSEAVVDPVQRLTRQGPDAFPQQRSVQLTDYLGRLSVEKLELLRRALRVALAVE